MNKRHKELFVARYGKLFSLYLTVDFIEKDDFFVIEAKKFNLKIESSNKNIEEARKEFNEIFNLLIKEYINEGVLFKVFDYLKITQQPVHKILEDKKRELFKDDELKIRIKQKVKFDVDEFMKSLPIEFNRVEGELNWEPIP